MKNITDTSRKLYIIISILLILMMVGCSGVKASKAEEQLALGKKNMEQGQYDEAIDCFYKAIEDDHLCEEAYCGIVDSFVAQDRNEEAQFVLEKGIQVFTSEGMDAELLSKKQLKLFGVDTNKGIETENKETSIDEFDNPIKSPTEENEHVFEDEITYEGDTTYEGVDLLNEVRNKVSPEYHENLAGDTIYEGSFIKTSERIEINGPLINGLKKYVEECERSGLDSILFGPGLNQKEAESCELKQLYYYMASLCFQCSDMKNYKEYRKKWAILDGKPELFSKEAFGHEEHGGIIYDVWYDEYGRTLKSENKDLGIVSVMEYEGNHIVFSENINNNPDNKYDIKKIYEYNKDGTISKMTVMEKLFDDEFEINEVTYSYIGNFIKKENSKSIPPFTYYLLDENGRAYDPYAESYEEGLEIFKDIINESSYTDEELCNMAVNHYISHNGKPRGIIVNVVSKLENQIGIKVYWKSGGATSSPRWYFIDSTTLSGYEGTGYDSGSAVPVDLNEVK